MRPKNKKDIVLQKKKDEHESGIFRDDRHKRIEKRRLKRYMSKVRRQENPEW